MKERVRIRHILYPEDRKRRKASETHNGSAWALGKSKNPYYIEKKVWTHHQPCSLVKVRPETKKKTKTKTHTSRPGEVKLFLFAQPQRCSKRTLLLDEYFHLCVPGHNIHVHPVAIHQQQTHHVGNLAGEFHSQFQNKQIKARNDSRNKASTKPNPEEKILYKASLQGLKKTLK